MSNELFILSEMDGGWWMVDEDGVFADLLSLWLEKNMSVVLMQKLNLLSLLSHVFLFY